eukprot:5389024-Prymnesium_polylepis.1
MTYKIKLIEKQKRARHGGLQPPNRRERFLACRALSELWPPDRSRATVRARRRHSADAHGRPTGGNGASRRRALGESRLWGRLYIRPP